MSEMWKRKVGTCFHLMDFDKDGVISKKDFDLMADGLCAQKKHDPAYQDALRMIFYEGWLKYTGSTKTNVKELMTEAVMIDSLMKQRNDPKLKATFLETCQIFFASMDTNKDGFLQLEEFRRVFFNMGFPDTSLADHIFKVIDTNHDGKISPDEYAHAIVESLLSEDEDSPYNMLCGHLI